MTNSGLYQNQTIVTVQNLPPLPFSDSGVENNSNPQTRESMKAWVPKFQTYISSGGHFNLDMWSSFQREVLALDLQAHNVDPKVLDRFIRKDISNEELYQALMHTYIREKRLLDPKEALKDLISKKLVVNAADPSKASQTIAQWRMARQRCQSLDREEERQLLSLARDNFIVEGLQKSFITQVRNIWIDEKHLESPSFLSALNKLQEYNAESMVQLTLVKNKFTPEAVNEFYDVRNLSSSAPQPSSSNKVRKDSGDKPTTKKEDKPRSSSGGLVSADGVTRPPSKKDIEYKAKWGLKTNCRKCGSSHHPNKSFDDCSFLGPYLNWELVYRLACHTSGERVVQSKHLLCTTEG